MPIAPKDIEHIAELARLRLTPAEQGQFGNQLASVLGYVEKLQEVDTSGVEITAQVSGLSDVWRPDAVNPWNQEEVAAALAQGELVAGQVKVKRVL